MLRVRSHGERCDLHDSDTYSCSCQYNTEELCLRSWRSELDQVRHSVWPSLVPCGEGSAVQTLHPRPARSMPDSRASSWQNKQCDVEMNEHEEGRLVLMYTLKTSVQSHSTFIASSIRCSQHCGNRHHRAESECACGRHTESLLSRDVVPALNMVRQR